MICHILWKANRKKSFEKGSHTGDKCNSTMTTTPPSCTVSAVPLAWSYFCCK